MAEQSLSKGGSRHVNVTLSFLFQLLFGIAFSIALGPLFDVYLYQLGGGDQGGNILVGKVESVNGLVALLCVIPVGIIVDTWDRVMLMKLSAVIGICAAVSGAAAIVTGSIPVWYVAMAINGVFSQLSNSVCYALFADSVSPEQRTEATANMGIVANVAQAAGPVLTFISMLYLGDNWTMRGLQIVLMVGMAIFFPLCSAVLFFFKEAPYGSKGSGEDGEEEAENAEMMKLPGARFVPWLACISDLITCIGAGMTIKYFNLYWKNNWHMNPTAVLAIAAVMPLSIAFFIKLLKKPAECIGRAQASLCCFLTGSFCFIVLAITQNLPVALIFYFVRSGMANAVYPYNKSIMFDFTPSSQRGRWNAVETLSGSVWSGSAFIGGYLANQHGYGFTFLVTAGIYAFACLVYSPLLCIVPRKSAGLLPENMPVAASPGAPGFSPSRHAAQVKYASPSSKKATDYVAIQDA